MVKKDKHIFKNNIVKTQVRVVEGYIDENKKIKQKTIKNFGYLEDQADQKAFLEEVEKFNSNFLKTKKMKKDSFNCPFVESTNNTTYNYGYRFLESIFDSLELNIFFEQYYSKAEYNLNDIFKFLTIERILNPDSKRATLQMKNDLYNFLPKFELHDIYRALDKFNVLKIDIQKYINDKIKELLGRDSTFAYYDVTNYYNEIDFPKDDNDLRQRGVSKEHRVDPIIQLGLFMDNNGLPISMSLFKGNTSDTKTLQPVMKEIKKNYNLNRLVVVADKGLNSSNNINYICNNGDGYVVSQILRGKKGKRYHDRLFDEKQYTYNETKTFKYQEFLEDYEGVDETGQIILKTRKVLIYWKLDDAILQARKRDDKLERAIKSLGNNSYAIKHTYEQFIYEQHTIEQTGEVADSIERSIDNDKVNEDALYDGYFCIITSELDYDYKKILEVYGGLWRIEESFRITKSELDLRPIYVSTESRINGHFLVCYTALLIIRMMQLKLNYKISVERIVRALSTSNCIIEEDDSVKILKNKCFSEYDSSSIKISDQDESLNDFLKILDAFNVSIPMTRYNKKTFQFYLNNIKYGK